MMDIEIILIYEYFITINLSTVIYITDVLNKAFGYDSSIIKRKTGVHLVQGGPLVMCLNLF